ncbi:heparin/heparan-sulfate lyase [Sphingobacterium yanglingense]|uniref:Heparin/heparan-sulfate lyase n=2 Tax=Sphingobacterium yanglingense TaxID=1437280 RepID=A0A4R6WDE0_9SPHI|nr:heparin/heparan-sulfate lyase [Sphingobacterium yanglingense]
MNIEIMKRFFIMFLLLAVSWRAECQQRASNKVTYTFGTDQMKLNSKNVEIVENQKIISKKGVSLHGRVQDSDRDADIAIDLSGVEPGRYVVTTQAYSNRIGDQILAEAKTKFESLFITLQFENQNITKRVVFAPWELNKQPSRQASGKFNVGEESKSLKLWLPEGVILESVSLKTYVPPVIPELAQQYVPKVLPPQSRPRLWVNANSLPVVKARLEQGENKLKWERVKTDAIKPYDFAGVASGEIPFDEKLEKAAEAKAFYFLMTGDKKVGREAVDMMKNYISHVEFGNLLDITREIGRAIYVSSLVYDWCYTIIREDERTVFVENLLRLSDDMEIGWPPFLQSVVNGHGNEAQVCRDLLSMSIAIYDENPEPYKYISYSILEQLVPMRKFEYQSPRHNQGVNYGSYRFTWDLHAAWLYYRMTGTAVFDDNIKDVGKYWLYARLPDGEMLRDGDGFGASTNGAPYYWKAPLFTLLASSYAEDPVLKADFERQGGMSDNQVLFLLLNDPQLIAEKNRGLLPLTKDFGPVLGSMIARTGWNISAKSSDVVAEIKGGGYHFGNHQHSDAGSIQLYYKGLQFGDLGVYRFYGTPYDFNFNKRSIAHSMMLVVDPEEKYPRAEANDGGTKFNQRFPKSPEETKKDPWFDNGTVMSANYGPEKLTPYYSFFSADLTNAYGNSKIEKYIRSFCFLNLNRKDIPALIILNDKIRAKDSSFKKYWQVNALNKPEIGREDLILTNSKEGDVGKIHIKTLIPSPADRDIQVLSGDLANNSFDYKSTPPLSNLPETKGHRIMLSPRKESKQDEFLTVFQVAEDGVQAMAVKYLKTDVSYVVVAENNVVSMSRLEHFIETEFSIEAPQGKQNHIVLTGLKEGLWSVYFGNRKNKLGDFQVDSGKNTLYFEGKKGKYWIVPAF